MVTTRMRYEINPLSCKERIVWMRLILQWPDGLRKPGAVGGMQEEGRRRWHTSSMFVRRAYAAFGERSQSVFSWKTSYMGSFWWRFSWRFPWEHGLTALLNTPLPKIVECDGSVFPDGGCESLPLLSPSMLPQDLWRLEPTCSTKAKRSNYIPL